jgi:tetratricopeptide (TPR) repeat protein
LISAILALVAASCVTPTPVERAMSLARLHREDEGIALLRRDIATRPDDLEARRLLIRLLAVASDLPAARDEVAALAARLPAGDPSPWIELGHALELVHQFDEAMAAYQSASDAAPESPAGPREAGMRAAHWGEWEASRGWLEEAVRRGAHDADTWHTLGVVRLNLHDLDGARAAYSSGVATDPNAVDCWMGLATVSLAARDWAGALVAYDAVLQRRPAWGNGELGRAWALARLGRKAEAARALDQAEELGAEREALARQRGLLRAEQGPTPAPP